MVSFEEAREQIIDEQDVRVSEELDCIICPACDEPVYKSDYLDHSDWSKCPVCGLYMLTGDDYDWTEVDFWNDEDDWCNDEEDCEFPDEE
jgi:transcription elongation factor Elf1